MNKIYKIIWSRTKNCYVVASELAKSHTKGATTSSSSKGLKGSALVTAVLATVAVSALSVQSVQAEASTISGQPGIAITNSGLTGDDVAQASHSNSIAIGNSAKATATNGDAIAIGGAAEALEQYTVAIGQGASAKKGQNIAIGNRAETQGIYSMAIGNPYITRVLDTSGKVVQSTVYTTTGTKSYATALGPGATASEYKTIALGANTLAEGTRSISIGGSIEAANSPDKRTITQGTNSIAIGSGTQVINSELSDANKNGAMATNPDGTKSETIVDSSSGIAIGYNTTTTQRYGISIGSTAGVTGVSGIAIGVNSSTAARSAVSIGDQAEADSINAVALGNFAKAKAKVSTVTNPDGSTSTVTTIASSAIAIGDNAHAYDQYTIAVGRSAAATANTAIAVGDKANASGSGSIAIGSTASSAEPLATAIGANSKATKSQATALGSGAQATGFMALALGAVSNASGDRSVVAGQSAGADKKFGTAVGVWSKAQGDSAVALGAMAKASGKRSIAIGGSEPEINKNNEETMEGAISTAATGENSVAMGYGATATYDNSVALGSNATTDAAVGTASATIAGKTVNFAGSTPVGTVSVGKSGVTTRATGDGPEYRTITNVAAGRISADSTDAINGSQLYAVNDALTNLVQSGAGSVTYVDGEGNPVVEIGGKYYPEGTKTDDKGNPVQADGKTLAEEVKTPVSAGTTTPNSGLGLPLGEDAKAIEPAEATTIVGGNGKDGDPGKDGLLGASGADLSKVATVADLQAVAQAGLDFAGDTGDDVHRPLSKKLTVYGEADTENLTAGNIGVVANGKDSLAIKLAKDITLPNGSVTAPNYQTDNNGNIVDADGNPLIQGDDGKWYNPDDLKDLTYDPATDQYVDKNGNPANPTEGTPVELGKTSLGKDGLTVAGKDGEDGKTVVGKGGITITPAKGEDGTTKAPVSLTDKGLDNGGNPISNVGPGTKPTDAATLGQVQELADKVGAADDLGKVDEDGDKVISVGDKDYKVDENGNPVDEKGNTLVKGDDGKYYPPEATKDDNGNMVVPDGNGGTKPAEEAPSSAKGDTSLASDADKSGLGLPTGTNGDGSDNPTTGKTPAIDEETAKTVVGGNGKDGDPGKDGLLGASGADLSKLATVGDLQAVAQAGLDFTGDTVDAEGKNVVVHRPLSKTLAVTGGADVTKLTDNNIGVVADAEKGLAIKLAKDIVLTNGSVAAVPYKTDDKGNVVDAAGNTLTAQPDGTFQDANGKPATPAVDPGKAVTLTDKGLDNGGNKITNVAAGTDPTDAVNFQQYQDLKDAVDGIDGNSGSKLVDGKGNEVVKIGDNYYPAGTKVDNDGNPVQADGKTPVTPIDTTQNPISAVIEAPNSGLGLPLGEDAKAIKPEDATTIVGGNGKDGDPGKDGLLGAKGADLSKLATVGDLQAVAQAGLDFTGDTVDAEGNKVVVHRPLSKTLAVTGGADVTKLTDNNIGVVADAETGLAIKLAKDIDLADGSVTTKGYQDAEGNPLVKGEDGKYYPEGALDDLTYNPETGKYVDDQGNTPADLKDVPLAKENEAVYDGNGTTVTAKDPDGNALGKTTVGADGLTVAGKDGEDGKTVVGKDGITITPAKGEDGTTKAPVSLTDKGLDNGGNPISNVGPGTKPTDAATLGQVQELADKVGAADDLDKVDEDGDKVISVGDKDYKVDENGNPVDEKGNTLVKGDDGKYYPPGATKDDNGNMVVPDGNGGTKPAEEAPSSAKGDTSLASDADKSGLGLPIGTNGDDSDDPNTGKTPAIDEETAKTVVGGNGKDGDPGKDGLLGASGADLSKLATVGDLQALAQAGLDFDGDAGTYVHRPLSKKLTVYGEADTESLTAGNIGVVANGKDSLALKLAKDINLPNGSVTTTNYQTNEAGNVVDADGNPLTQGDDGKWYKADDVKGLTYDPANNQYVDKDGKPANLTEGTPVETGNAVYNGDGIDVTDKDGNNTKVTGEGVSAKDKDGNTTTVKGNGITVAGKDGENGKTVIGKDGITITPESGNTVSLTDKGLDNGGNQVKGVGDATEDTDAVNYKQLKDLAKELAGGSGLGLVDKDGNKVVKGDDGNYYPVDENGNPVVVDEEGNPLVNVGDKYYNPDNLAKDEQGNIIKNDDGKPVSIDDNTMPATPSETVKAEGTTISSNTDSSALGRDLGDDAKAITAENGEDGTPGATELIGGKDDGNGNKTGGLLQAEGSDLSKLATKGDLQAVAQAGLNFQGNDGEAVHAPLSDTVHIVGDYDKTKTSLVAGNIGVTNIDDKLTIQLAKDINLGNDGSIKLGDKVNLDGDTGLTVKGDDGKEANYGSDGSTIKDGKGNENKSTAGGNTITDGDGNKTETKADSVTTSDGKGNSSSLTPEGTTVTDANGNQTKIGPDGITIGDSKGNTYVTINENGLSGKEGAPVDFGNGLNVPGALTVKPESKDADGNTLAPVIDANGNRIQNVGTGILPTDAVNVGQLNGVKHDLNSRMNVIGAHAAAMAALHPMEFANGEKTSIAAGIGTFQSKQAMAIGAFYRPNDDTMFSVGGSFGSSENMFNVGVSLRLGADGDENKYEQKYRKAPLSTIAVLDDKVDALEQENTALKDSVAASNAENASLKQEVAGQKAELQAQRQELEAQREQIKLLMERLGM